MFFGVRAHYNPALYDHTAFFFLIYKTDYEIMTE